MDLKHCMKAAAIAETPSSFPEFGKTYLPKNNDFLIET